VDYKHDIYLNLRLIDQPVYKKIKKLKKIVSSRDFWNLKKLTFRKSYKNLSVIQQSHNKI